MKQRPIFPVFIIAFAVLVAGCDTPYSPQAFPGWVVDDIGEIRTASRSVEAEEGSVTVTITGSEAAIVGMLNGRLGVSYYDSSADEVIVLLERRAPLESAAARAAEVVHVAVRVESSRSAQVSGSGMDDGARVQYEHFGGLGCSADIETISGNADLELYRGALDGTWVLEDGSYSAGTLPDQVSCGTWLSYYRVRVLAAADATSFMGTIYW